MKNGLIAATVVLSAFTWTTIANATTLLFSYTEGSAGISFSFQQISNPVPIDYLDDSFTEVSASKFKGIGPYSSITWFNADNLGQFATSDGAYVFYGDQVYSGFESAPVFTTGIFSAVDENNGLSGTLTVSAVPEPSTWALMLLGFGGLGFASYRRRAMSAAAFAAG